MIIFCKNCGRLNQGEYKSAEDAVCVSCNTQMLPKSHEVITACPGCNLIVTGDIWNWPKECKSCKTEIINPLKFKCWGKTVNKGHNFKKFSLNLNHDEMDWLKEMSQKEKVQAGQILRLLIRKEAGLICVDKKAK
jgi:predicted RNA-binding Zn-ribbon protein involved in translation (DUF1610 family)